jgi:hypothetical protein
MKSLAPVLITLTGIGLMAFKIYADSEPGAIPLGLIVVGVGWYVVARIRRAGGREK